MNYDMFDGQGCIIYSDGIKYEGKFLNNRIFNNDGEVYDIEGNSLGSNYGMPK